MQKNGQDDDSVAQTSEHLLKTVHALAVELNPRHIAPGLVTLDSVLDRDLGFDSLGRVELLVRLEQGFDIALGEQALMNAETPRDLLRAILGASGRVATRLPAASEGLALGDAEAAPHSAQTLIQVLDWHVQAHPDRPHIRLYSDDDDGEIITYGDLADGAGKIARGLQGLGLSHGEAVMIMLPSGRDYFYAFMGVLRAGGVPVPVYPPGRIGQLEEHLLRHVAIAENCQTRIMIAMPEAVQFSKLLRGQVACLRHVVTPEEVCAVTTTDLHPPTLKSDDMALLQYTSGSTGTPKGVVLSHANLLANIRAVGTVMEASPEDVFVSWLPLYHDMGLIGAWLSSFYYAAHLVILSPLAFIARPARWFQAIHRYGGTLSAAPNFAYDLCLNRLSDDQLEGLDLSSWRATLNGAEPVSPNTIERFGQRFADIGFRPETMMPVYGLAENSVGLTIPPLHRVPLIDRVERTALMIDGHAKPAAADDPTALQFPACGQPLPGHQIRIVDGADLELPDRHEGYIHFRGPSATSGYLRAVDANKAMFHGDWLATGDKGYIADGEIYISGREKDIIIRAGRNIYPQEVEQEVGKIDGIRHGNVAVFGSVDKKSGTERLIVLAETRKRDPEILAEQRRQVMAIVTDLTGTPPDDVVLAPPNTVPKTSSGKIRRAASRQIYDDGEIGKAKRAVWIQVARLSMGAVMPQVRRTRALIVSALYAAGCVALFGSSALCVWAIVMVLPSERWRWSLAQGTIKVLMRICGIPMALKNPENLPPAGVPCIFVSNHQSYVDALVMLALLPARTRFVVKTEVQGSFFLRTLLNRFDTLFVERFDSAKGVAGARSVTEIGHSGRSLMFFAEGTFTRMPGLLPFRMGAFETAVETKMPIIPLALRGSRSVLRGDQFFPRRGIITIITGPAIDPQGSGFQAAVRLRDETREWILRNCSEPDLGHERVPRPGET